MTITVISQVYFHWYEFETLVKFEQENPTYRKIAEDTTGTTYEYRTCQVLDYVTGRKEE